MALPVSGNAISLGQVNTELGISPSTTTISLNQAAVRALFIKSSGAIAMSDGHGKSAESAPVITANPSGYVWTAGGKTISYSSAGHRNLEYYAPQQAYAVGFSGGTLHSSVGDITLSYNVTGTNNVYRWQYAADVNVAGAPYMSVQGVSEATDSPYMIRQSPEFRDHPIQPTPGDIINVANTNTLSLSLRNFPIQYNYEYGYFNQPTPVAGNPATGYWRLKVSNSLGTIYSGWTNVYKEYDQVSFTCNCTTGCSSCCGCGCSTCYDQCCDENNENCVDCNPHDCNCDNCCSDCNCTTGCSTCYSYSAYINVGTVYTFITFKSYSAPQGSPGYVDTATYTLT